MFKRACFYLLSLVLVLAYVSDSTAQSWTLKMRLANQSIVGTPVYSSQSKAIVLARDGRLWEFSPSQAKDYEKISDSFQSYNQQELRSQLMQEFGPEYEVSGTGHYLVVHPKGQRKIWAQRFEDLYRSFHVYFNARGFKVQSPQFPLVAIVTKDYDSYAKYAASERVKVTPRIVGYYSTKTNRVVMYDITAGKKDSQGWNDNFATVVHEATHQTAYNTSIHNRLSAQPVWIVEGLATMFEAPGVWNSSQFRHQKDRINRERWAYFVQHAKSRRKTGSLESFIASDQPFKTNPSAAYAEAWALSFYLMETSPKQYSQYLAQVSARPAGSRYSAQQRVKDFQTAFGQDFKMIEARMLRFILELE